MLAQSISQKHQITTFNLFKYFIIPIIVTLSGNAADQPTPNALVIPSFTRLDLAPGAAALLTVQFRSSTTTLILAAQSNCRCLSLTTPLPVTVTANTSVSLTLRVVGVQTGIERLTLRTTAGTVSTDVQVVTNGLGQGRDVLMAALRRAQAEHQSAWLIVHDLRGQVRNCGCTNGSLGGIDILAALPAWCRAQMPDVPLRFFLTGDTDGHQSGVGAALANVGWQMVTTIEHADPSESAQALRVCNNPTPFLTTPGITAVVTTGASALNHRRIVRPVADGGMTAMLLRVDKNGDIAEQVVIPIDRTLPTDATILARFPERLTAMIGPPATRLADTCAPCHASAATAWNHSRHAHAWNSLKPADQVDGCVSCHSTRMPSATVATIAPGIACQACHQGTDAHLASGGTVKTTGAVSCQSCHAPRHDPGFVREKAWQIILHGKEVAR